MTCDDIMHAISIAQIFKWIWVSLQYLFGVASSMSYNHICLCTLQKQHQAKEIPMPHTSHTYEITTCICCIVGVWSAINWLGSSYIPNAIIPAGSGIQHITGKCLCIMYHSKGFLAGGYYAVWNVQWYSWRQYSVMFSRTFLGLAVVLSENWFSNADSYPSGFVATSWIRLHLFIA